MEQIGVSSVFETSQFRTGLGQYLNGLDEANKATQSYVDKAGRLRDAEGRFLSTGKSAQAAAKGVSQVAQAAAEGSSRIGGFASAMGNVLQVATGIIVADVFGKIASGVGQFVSMGVQAVGAYQQIEMGLNALLTSSNMYKQVTNEVTTAVTEQLMTDGEYAQRLDELNAKLAVQRSSMQEHQERIRQLTEQYGDNGLVVIKAKDQLNQMQVAIRGTEQDIAGLTKSTTSYGTELVQSFQQVMDFGDAQSLASKQAKELLSFVDELSVVSPFEQSQVATVTKLAAAANLGVEDIKSFTSGFLDLAAGVGIGSESLAFAGDQLLQVAKVGKLNLIDIRQLRRLGINLEQIIGVQMGMTIDEFNEKAANSPEIFNELFRAVADFSKNTFAGTAKKMATSVSGLQSTLSDIFTVSSRKLLQPLIEAVSPMASDILGKISDVVLGPKTEAIGKALAKGVFGVFRLMSGDDLGVTDIIQAAVGMGAGADTAANIANIASSILDLSMGLSTLIQTGQAGDLMTALGLSPEVQETISGILQSINDGIAQVQSGGGGDLITDLATRMIANVPNALGAVIGAATDFLTNEWPAIHDTLMEWSVKFWDWAAEAAKGAGTFMMGMGAALLVWASSPEAGEQMAQIGKVIADSLISGTATSASNSEQMLTVVTNLVGGLAVAIVALGGSLILLGGQLLANVIAGVIEKATGSEWKVATLEEFKGLITMIGETDWGAVGTGIMDWIAKTLAEGANNIASKLTSSAKAWGEIITKSRWDEIGKNIVMGLLKGISDNVSKVYEKIKEMAVQAISEAMGAWGVNSPSTEFAWLSEMAVEGAVLGFEQNKSKLWKTIDKAFGVDRALANTKNIIAAGWDQMDDFFEGFLDNDKADLAVEQMRQVFVTFKKEILGSSDRVKTFMEKARSMVVLGENEFSGDQVIGDRAYANFLDAWDKAVIAQNKKLQEAIRKGTQSMTEAANKLIDMAFSAADLLDEQIGYLTQGILRGWEDIGLDGQIYSAAEAQDLLNAKMAEQLAIQDDLAQLRQSEDKLAMLNKQLELVDTVKKAGLDVNEFFSGISMGQDATVGGMVEATNRVVQLLIEKAASNLSQLAPGAAIPGTSLFGNTPQASYPARYYNQSATAIDSSSRVINVNLGDMYLTNQKDMLNLKDMIVTTIEDEL